VRLYAVLSARPVAYCLLPVAGNDGRVRMDTTDYPSFGGLARMNALLAVDARRVRAFADSHLDEFELLFRAATSCDWATITQAAGALAAQRVDSRNKSVVQSARKVRDSLRRDPTGAKAGRKVAELLSACRAAKVHAP
jgi:hypothetical protein